MWFIHHIKKNWNYIYTTKGVSDRENTKKILRVREREPRIRLRNRDRCCEIIKTAGYFPDKKETYVYETKSFNDNSK